MRDVVKVRGELTAAQSALQRAVDDPGALRTPEGRTAAVAGVDAALVSIDDARRDAKGSSVLSLLGAFPLVGSQREGLIALIDDSSTAASAGRGLLAKVNDLAGRNQLQDGRVPLDSLGELQAEVAATGGALDGLRGRSHGLWGPVGDARRHFDELAGTGATRLTDAADALGAARSFLGSASGRRYLVALENNAEMRDQGAVLSYVVVRFDGGALSFERRGSVADLTLTRPAPTVLPTGTLAVFGPLAPTQTWQSVNATADFALSGQAMADMYRQATGQGVDGVIGIDVPGLAGVLRAVGPVSIDAVAEPIGPDNIGRLLLHDFYQGLGPTSDTTIRRERLGDVVAAMVARLTTGRHDAVTLGRELGDGAAGGHLRLWSATGTEEDVFQRTGLGGGPALRQADRTFHVAVQNRTATKLDYYVKPSVHQDVELSKEGTATVRTTVTLDNTAPIQTAPSYQLGPDRFTQKPGDYLAWVLLWGPAGSTQSSGGVQESGLNLAQRIVDVGAAQSRTVTFETVIPNAVRDGKLQLRLVPQPRLEPVAIDLKLSAPGWRVSDDLIWKGVLDKVQTVTWRVDR
jgi:hypothetical protein